MVRQEPACLLTLRLIRLANTSKINSAFDISQKLFANRRVRFDVSEKFYLSQRNNLFIIANLSTNNHLIVNRTGMYTNFTTGFGHFNMKIKYQYAKLVCLISPRASSMSSF